MPSSAFGRFVGGAGHVSPSSPYIVIEQLAERWHCSVSGVRKKLSRGDIPPGAYTQVGGKGRLLFRVSEIERLEREST